ncbi:MAG: alkaline phosphatase family protein [bacterium]
MKNRKYIWIACMAAMLAAASFIQNTLCHGGDAPQLPSDLRDAIGDAGEQSPAFGALEEFSEGKSEETPISSSTEPAKPVLKAPGGASASEAEAADDPLAVRSKLQAVFDGGADMSALTERPPAAAQNLRPSKSLPAEPAALKAGATDFTPPMPSDRGTLVLIQIDGLSYNRLMEAISKGRAKNIAEMVRNGGFSVSTFFCGIPTVTMSVQSQIFFGRILPGNDWFSKSKNSEVGGAVIEKDVPAEEGLLYGGRVFLSELSGGGGEGVNVRVWMDEDIEKHGTFFSIAKQLWQGIPYLLSSGRFPLITFWKDWRQMKKDFATQGYETEKDKDAPLYVSMLSNFAAIVATEGIRKAIRDNVPSVYTDFSGYDEKAHYYGFSSEEAFGELDKIDENLRRIMKTAKQHGARVFVFSDHGQTPSETFIGKFGKKPQEVLDEFGRDADAGYKDGSLVFAPVYSMGNIYVRNTTGHLGAAEIEKRHPGLIAKLANHAGVGAVIARKENDIVLASRNGRAVISGGALSAVDGENPLAQYLDERMNLNILSVQITNYMRLEESGDLVILAPYENGKTLDYNLNYTLISEHGGVGGEQMHPFIIYDPRVITMDPETFIDARQLNVIFKSLLKR